MADEQDSPNDVGEEGENPDYNEQSTAVITDTTATPVEDYADEPPIEDYVVNMVVNEQPDGVSLSPDLVNAGITDIYGNTISRTGLINGYTTAIYDELNANGTAIAGGKRWWSYWSTQKIILFGLLALCILGIILAIVFLVIGKKFNKNKRSTAAGPITTTKAVVTKGVSPESKYHPVPNV